MRDKTKALWETQDQHKGDRWRLFQAGYEGKIWAADLSRQVQEAGNHSRHAQADRYGKRLTA